MRLQSIDHFVITTKDLEACLRFYAELLGMEHRVVNGQHALHFGNQKINLHTRPHEFQPSATQVKEGSQDFCLITEDDLAEVKKIREAAGVTIIEGVVERGSLLTRADAQ